MIDKIVTVDNVSFRYDEHNLALKNVTFNIKEGEWLAIVGHNGSGKSTLAKLLNGLHFPKTGKITVAGETIDEESIWEIRRQIGMVFQNPDNQFVGTTVQDDVAFGLENNGIEREIMISRVNEALQRVEMTDFINHEPHNLSGGQKQRVAIAGVLALRPKIIILDEATSMLDPRGREEVLNIVRELKDESNMTVVSITHDLEEAVKADRIIVMNQGEVFHSGTPAEIFQMEEKLLEIGLDMPFTVKMRLLLEKHGIKTCANMLDEEELVNELWTSHFSK